MVGIPTHITVALRNKEGSNNYKDAILAWSMAEYAYLTLENDKTVFSALSTRLNGNVSDPVEIRFVPKHAGTFNLTIDLLSKDGIYPIRHKRYASIVILGEYDGIFTKEILPCNVVVQHKNVCMCALQVIGQNFRRLQSNERRVKASTIPTRTGQSVNLEQMDVCAGD